MQRTLVVPMDLAQQLGMLNKPWQETLAEFTDGKPWRTIRIHHTHDPKLTKLDFN